MPDRREAFERELSPEPGRTALVVVDMQRGFLDPGEAMEVAPAREIVPAIRSLLDLFRAKHLPVVFTEFVYSERVRRSSSDASTPSTSQHHREHPAASDCPPPRAWREPRAPTPCPTWRRGRASWSSASAATTRSPARRSTARCGR